MIDLYSVKIVNHSQVLYYRVDFFEEALDLASMIINKLGNHVSGVITKLIYNKKGELVNEVVKIDF